MRTIIVKLLIMFVALSATGLLETPEVRTNGAIHDHESITNVVVEYGQKTSSSSNCCSDCAFHQCHLNHCKYVPLSSTYVASPLSISLSGVFPLIGMILDDFPLGLMRPPSV